MKSVLPSVTLTICSPGHFSLQAPRYGLYFRKLRHFCPLGSNYHTFLFRCSAARVKLSQGGKCATQSLVLLCLS